MNLVALVFCFDGGVPMLSDVRSRLSGLRECCYPFSLLSGHRAAEALESLRTYELSQGERLALQPGKGGEFLYLLEGEAEIHAPGAEPDLLHPAASHGSPYRLEPAAEPVTVVALANCLLCRADGEILDYLLSWETLSEGLGDEVGAEDRIGSVRRSLAFRRLPLENVEEAFRRMRGISVAAGQEIVRQGEPGDAFYVIQKGRAEVWQTGIYDDEPQLVGELGPGDPFGEEALILRGSRNATVRMVEDGVLLVLGQEDFDELFQKAMIRRVQPALAKALLDDGHGLLDVRYEEEFEESRIPGCVLVPLHELRRRVTELDPSRPYLVYCKGGSRSAVATLLLRQRGFDAVSIDGGLRDWPFEIVTG